MAEHNGAVLVMEGKACTGFFSSVITPAAWCCWAELATTLVGEIMTRKGVMSAPSIGGSAVHGADDRQKHPPLAGAGAWRCAGMVSMRDVVRATLDAQAQTIEQLVSYIQQ